jgi:hypothetical protein
VLGDGRLRWRPELGQIDHPVLLQRVELTFDPSGPEFEVNDAERLPELYSPLLQEAEALTSERLQQLRKDLSSGAYHPLSGEAADGFFTRLAPLLGRQGTFSTRSSRATRCCSSGHVNRVSPRPSTRCSRISTRVDWSRRR